MLSTRIPTRFEPAQRGVTLVELMVSVAVGALLLIGTMTVFMQSKTGFVVNEAMARLQENANYALDILEPEIRMAQYWGLTSRTYQVQGKAGPAEPTPAGLGVSNDCGLNWSIDLDRAVAGSNNDGYPWGAFCGGPFGGAAGATSDTLEMRRVTEDSLVLLTNGVIYMQTVRFQDPTLFTGNAIPLNYSVTNSQTHALITRGFYVSQNSSLSTPANPIPSLRMKNLVGALLGPSVVDQEIIPGVEDFQVQFGVDTDLEGSGAINGRGTVDRYVSASDPIIDPTAVGFIPDARILAVRIWLRLRSDRPENGHFDTTNYVYADQNIPAPNDSFRRLLVSKTIYLRNARPGS
jgi:type IV pilus assembly protein PilW